MLEIGWGIGASSKMWMKYFNSAIFYMLSIEDNPHVDILDDKRFVYIKGNQSDSVLLEDLINTGIKFSFIIDDGSHVPEDMLFTLGKLLPIVESGGYYIIEDLDWRHYKPRHSEKFDTTVPLMIDLIDTYQKKGYLHNKLVTMQEENNMNSCIDNIKIYDRKLAIIKRM
jgi:hypothetical protein